MIYNRVLFSLCAISLWSTVLQGAEDADPDKIPMTLESTYVNVAIDLGNGQKGYNVYVSKQLPLKELLRYFPHLTIQFWTKQNSQLDKIDKSKFDNAKSVGDLYDAAQKKRDDPDDPIKKPVYRQEDLDDIDSKVSFYKWETTHSKGKTRKSFVVYVYKKGGLKKGDLKKGEKELKLIKGLSKSQIDKIEEKAKQLKVIAPPLFPEQIAELVEKTQPFIDQANAETKKKEEEEKERKRQQELQDQLNNRLEDPDEGEDWKLLFVGTHKKPFIVLALFLGGLIIYWASKFPGYKVKANKDEGQKNRGGGVLKIIKKNPPLGTGGGKKRGRRR